MPGLPLGRDATILLLTVVVGVAVVVLVPPSGAPAAAAAAGPLRGPSRAGAASTTTTRSQPTTSATGAAASTTTTTRPAATTTTTATTTNAATTTATTTQSDRLKLMDSKYANYAFLISGQTLSPDAKRALDGFARNRTRINDSAVRVTLNPYESRYKRYSVVVRDDQKLYFIETSLGDDGPKRETELNDDAPVKVDSNGYVIK
ncbi:MAG: hypothetical protein ABEJ70_00405 [Halobacteriaceae archaeon]